MCRWRAYMFHLAFAGSLEENDLAAAARVMRSPTRSERGTPLSVRCR
jgi:hypothetical protein